MNRSDARMPKTIPQLLQIRAEESPSKTFLYYKDAKISYSRLDEIANSIANGLREDTGEEVIDYCKEHLADFKCPRRVEFAESFPKTATGKIQKNKIVEGYVEKSRRP